MSIATSLKTVSYTHPSKEIHERIADYTYDLIPLSKEAFHAFMEKRDFTAINVTIPYKKEVIPYLDEIDEDVYKRQDFIYIWMFRCHNTISSAK